MGTDVAVVKCPRPDCGGNLIAEMDMDDRHIILKCVLCSRSLFPAIKPSMRYLTRRGVMHGGIKL